MLNVLRLTSGVLKKLQMSDLAKLLLISSSTSTTTSHQQSIELTKSYLLERESVIHHHHHHHHCNKNKDSIDCAAEQKSFHHNQNVNENITTTAETSSSSASSSSSATPTITTTAAAAAAFPSVIGSTGGINLKKSEWSSTKSQNQESIDDSIKSYIVQDTSNNNKMEKSCAEKAVISSSSTANNSDVVNTKNDNKSSASPFESSSSSSSKGFEGSSCSKSPSSTTGKSCFASSLADILKFLELVGNLKHVKRTGWVLRDVKDCESISGHMYRMSMMTFLLDGTEGLDRTKCMELALVHDLAESLVGDITPFCGISREEKRLREMKAMEDICKLIEPRGNRIYELFLEYEEGESPESKFVKDLDRLDMVLQAFEYEKRDDCVLKHQEFFDSTDGKFSHPFVVKLVNEIYSQRKALALQKQQQHECQNGFVSAVPGTTSASDTNADENVVHQKKVSSS